MYVIETDRPCKVCGDFHGCATTTCNLMVFVDESTADMLARPIEGIVRVIDKVPDGVPHTVYLHKNGRPDPAFGAAR
jgi:hypothetical protein